MTMQARHVSVTLGQCFSNGHSYAIVCHNLVYW